jgi:hypothetical protein
MAPAKATRCKEVIVPVLSSGTLRPVEERQRNQVETRAPVVECSMFYVLIFSLAAVLLVIAFISAMARRRRTLRADDTHVSAGSGRNAHATHGTHPDAARRQDRKAKRAQSQHDRRKRR